MKDKKIRRLYGLKRIVYLLRHDPDREIQSILHSSPHTKDLVDEFIRNNSVEKSFLDVEPSQDVCVTNNLQPFDLVSLVLQSIALRLLVLVHEVFLKSTHTCND